MRLEENHRPDAVIGGGLLDAGCQTAAHHRSGPHLALVHDIDQSRHFYKDLLGYEEPFHLDKRTADCP